MIIRYLDPIRVRFKVQGISGYFDPHLSGEEV